MKLAPRLSLLASFAGARGLQFLAPIATANLLARADYGAVEFAHAAASVGVAVLSLGMPAMIPFVVVQGDTRYSLRAILGHQTALSVVCAVAALLALLLVGAHNPNAAMTGLFAAALSMQALWAYILRSRGATSSSLFIEASPFALVALGALLAQLFDSGHALSFVSVFIGIGTAAMLWGSVQSLRSTAGTPTNYTATLKAGVPLMVGGLLTLLATSAGRLGIGLFGNNQLTGEFAAIARIAALPIVAHQLLIVAAFRDLYDLPLPTLERLLTRVVLAVAAAVAAFLLTLPWIGPLFGPAFTEASQQHPRAAVLLLAQAVLWSGAALNDLVASRHEVMARILPFTGVALAASLLVAAWQINTGDLTVSSFAVWHTTILGVLFAAQACTMALAGVRFPRFWLACVSCFAAIVIPALILVRP